MTNKKLGNNSLKKVASGPMKAFGGAFWNSAIHPSVCPTVQLAIGTLAACSLATAGHQRCADRGPVRGRT